MKKQLLRWLGRNVYGTFVAMPSPLNEGAETYLESLWLDAPRSVAAMHTLLAIVTMCLPPFLLFKPKLLSGLGEGDRHSFVQRMMGSRLYPVRLMAYGVRGHALVAVFRNPRTRQHFFAKDHSRAEAV